MIQTSRVMPALIVLNHPLFTEVTSELLADFEVRVESALSPQTASLAEASGVVTLLTTPVDEAFLHAAPRLKVVANYAVGTDNIDLGACARRNVVVTNTPDVLTDATAELAVALLFACARRIVEADAFTRRGAFAGWSPDLFLGQQLSGRSAVIVGGGRIGERTGALLRALGLSVQTLTRQSTPAEIDRALTLADVLSLHLPYNETTHHWLDERRIARLPPSCIVINTARGPVVDEASLTDALTSGRLFAAGLDVYEREPMVPEALRALDNVVLAPHIGSATKTARMNMARLACQSVRTVLRGDAPAHVVTER